MQRGSFLLVAVALGFGLSACRPREVARVEVKTLSSPQSGTFTLAAGNYSVWEDLATEQGPGPPGSPKVRVVKRVDQCFVWQIEVEQSGKIQKASCPVFEPSGTDCSSSSESGGSKSWRYCRVPKCAISLAASGPTTLRATLERLIDGECQHLLLRSSALILAE